MRQGNDVGTQYRSVIFTHSDAQAKTAEASRRMFQDELTKAGYGEIQTEIRPAGEFYFAEDYHQQYLVKVPNGYCPDSRDRREARGTHRRDGAYCPVHSTGVQLTGPIVTMEQV